MPTSPTQEFIEIAGIQEGIVILKNGGYRMILSISAINFSLKSDQEQNSLIFQYQSFLNSLHFPIQIVMRSKKLDLQPYLKKISTIKDKQTNELIKMQTEDYIDFVGELINLANIMKKSFYVVVPYDPVTIKSTSIIDKLFNKKSPTNLRVSSSEFKRYKEELEQRANNVATGLGGMGIHCVQLVTEEIIELFYNIYNPEEADRERFSNVNELTSSFIADEKEKGKIKEPEENNLEEESAIDNSALVEDKRQKESQIQEGTSNKEAEKQITKENTAQASSAAKEPPPSIPPAQPSQAAPATISQPSSNPMPINNPAQTPPPEAATPTPPVPGVQSNQNSQPPQINSNQNQ